MLDGKHEREMFEAGFRIVAGVDEAGRGPLAGPVVAAAVAMSKDFDLGKKGISEIRDSKKLSHGKRERLHATVMDSFDQVGIGIAELEEIDMLNILNASLLAMRRAVEDLGIMPETVLVDGNRRIPGLDLLQRTIIGGDRSVLSIAAASIVAKVHRDRLMLALHEKYPQYGFDAHKGYGTREHLSNLRKYGPCPVHRAGFEPVRRLLKSQ